MSATQVFKLEAGEAQALEQRLRQELPETSEWRRVDYARFAVKALGVSLVCYTSGKVVLQGKQTEPFAARFLEGFRAEGPQRSKASSDLSFEVTTVGSDEAGKGDYFGPLVVASVYAAPSRLDELKAMGVADSKQLSDRRMYPIAERIEQEFACEVRMLMPPEYNEVWGRLRNVNHVLADLHADAIAALLAANDTEEVIVDRFAAESLVATRLRQKVDAMPAKLVQVPRAEAYPVVAAASIVARVRFLEGLRQCEADSGTDLHKGAGAPVDVAIQRVFAIGGVELLRKVGKVHFKNSERVPGLRQ